MAKVRLCGDAKHIPIEFRGSERVGIIESHQTGKRFVVFNAPEARGGDKGSVHVTMLLNFFDEVKRRIP